MGPEVKYNSKSYEIYLARLFAINRDFQLQINCYASYRLNPERYMQTEDFFDFKILQSWNKMTNTKHT